MKIKAILEQKPTVSFEVFPPKQWDKIEGTKAVVKEMVKSHPAFMSVTYGAAGTTSGFTTEIAREILDDGVTPLAHLTCLTSTRDKIHQVVAELQENGIENILALRGDIPRDFQFPAEQYFEHAYQLVNEIRTLGDFCIGGACYPEVHPESKNRVEDLEHLKQKVDCGVDFLTTQMFFDNTVFYNFREMCAIKGIDVPLIASGGCGNIQHIEDVLKEDAHAADAALAASIFHYGEHTVGEVKDHLSAHGIPVRMKVRS